MAKKKGKRGGGKTFRVVPATIVMKDTGILAAADAIMDPNVSFQDVAAEVQPPTIGTAVSVGLCKVMRGLTGQIYLGKFGSTKITLL